MVEVPGVIFEDQLCKVWGVSDDTLYRERKAGKLRCTPIGGRIAYTQAQIEEYMRLKAEEAATQPCRNYKKPEKKRSPSLGTTGSKKSKVPPTSTSPGTTSAPDKCAAERLGQTYFQKRKKN